MTAGNPGDGAAAAARDRRQVDLRLVLPASAAWAAAAALPAIPADLRWPLVAAGLAATLVAAARRHLAAIAAAVGLAAGAAAVTVQLAALDRGAVATLARAHADVELTVRLVRDPALVTAKRSGRHLVVADATVTHVRRDHGPQLADRAPVVLFAVGSGWLGLLPGQQLRVHARLAPPRAGDDVAAVGFSYGPPRRLGRPPPWQRWAGHIRDGLRTACGSLSADERGLVPGLVLGDVSAMPPALTAAFRATGLTHLNAVSGANVAIVLGAVLAAVRRVGLGRRGRTVVAAVALTGFAVLVRPSPSVLRASVMGAVALLAMLIGRRAAPLPALAGAVLTLVVLDPFLARTPGFAMSVLATAAIVTIAPAWTERLARHLPRPVAAAVAVPAAAQLACTPVIVAAFGQLTPYAVLANLLAAPAVAPATLAGIACALVAVVTPAAAALLAHFAGWPAGWLAVVARTLSEAPGAGLHAPAGIRGLTLLTAVTAGSWLVGRTVRRRRRRALRDAAAMGC
ncbi:MAG TPA: ComEC/Rec2 family competence protein [Mycobacteriales bacterium]|nr:ComEC/Rec2 family competence protein [Mycobacteriales bacterium]